MSGNFAVYDFMVAHSLETDANGNCRFSAIIDYSSRLQNDKSVTEVRFVRNGYDDGRILLAANSVLSVNNYHLEFNERFQTYEYVNETKELVIKGNSGKMGGNYSVTIVPV
ncbi:MAG: hypothetical protein B7X10_02270 [Burkholderiales bacterium 21-58-4]|nr:MAG: hypothetical protein B7X10_02270 [Burkholderiales bacterium 21-58-4]